MKRMSFEETKQVELDILKNFAAFCDANNLRYYLAYGTLIGAVRHKGFIPWDDDIDVWMPRPDYNRFLEIYNELTPDKKYKVISPFEKMAKHSFAKVIDTATRKIEGGFDYKNGYLGIDIDIFPLDGESDSDTEHIKFYNKKRILYKLHNKSVIKLCYGNWKGKLVNYCFFWTKPFKTVFLKYADKLGSKYDYESSKYVGSTECLYTFARDRFEKTAFDDFILLDFEGFKFKVPIGFDKVLTKLYGDYMQLPPEEDRITHHNNEMYWINQ